MNFNNNNANRGDFKLPLHPNSLSNTAKVFLTMTASFLMLVCSIFNMFGITANSPTVIMLAAVLSMLVYFIVGGICALLVLEASKLAPVPPIVTFVLTLLLFGVINGGVNSAMLSDALLSLFPSVGGTAMALAMKKGAGRTSAILVSSVSTGVFVAAVCVLSVYLAGGSVSGASISSAIDSARASFVEMFEEQIAVFEKEMPEYDFSGLDIEGSVNGIFNRLPAMIVLAFNVTAFFSNLSLLALMRILDLYHKLKKADTEFKVSIVTAVLYAASYLLTVVTVGDDSPAYAVFDNISTILMPALAVVGLMECLPKRDGASVRVGCFPLILSGSLMMFLPALGVLVLSFFGTFYIIRDEFKKHKKDEG